MTDVVDTNVDVTSKEFVEKRERNEEKEHLVLAHD
jgi:hypothetical protein